METRFGIDWISATFDASHGKDFITLPFIGQASDIARKHAKNGYTMGALYLCGMIAMWSPKNEKMGVHVVFSGKVLKTLQSVGVYPNEVLDGIDKCGGRVSRVDLAIDVTDSGLNCASLGVPKQPPEKIGRPLNFQLVTSSDESWTRYIGSRTSDKFIRIYDKAKEQGTPLLDIVRFELELKGKTAHRVGKLLGTIDATKAYALTIGMLGGMVHFDSPVWQSLFDHEKPSYFTIPKSQERNTITWLMTTCASALATQILEDESKDLLEQFCESVEYYLGEKRAAKMKQKSTVERTLISFS